MLGSEQKAPKWLPSYVGVYHDEGEEFIRLKESEYVRRMPPLSQAVLRESGLGNVGDGQLYEFMRKWFINSIFYRSNGIVLPMDGYGGMFRARDNKSRTRQSVFKE